MMTVPVVISTEFTWHYRSDYHEQYRIYEQSYQDCIAFNINEDNRVSICDNEPAVQNLKPDETLKYQTVFERDGEVVPYNDENRIDILSHVIPARTEPLGQDVVENKQGNSTVTEVFDNLQMLGFTDSNQDHSAPFHGYYSEKSPKNNSQQRALYWNLILRDSFILNENTDYTGLKNNIK